ncbi:hypothetical protein ACFVIM_02365 [Streptomyces sp. NPDC057638]|uniref:hypothetical protein n=1 Tax=Streptomyces sp. NPDC057638 TaxID=3346190 RepID=UPI00369F3101
MPTACRICGLDDGAELYDANGVPNYVICECCGNESGIGDENIGQVRELRGLWVGQGARWDSPKHRPEKWDFFQQIAQIPGDWR